MKAYLAIAAYLCTIALAQDSSCVSEMTEPFTITVDIGSPATSKRDQILNYLSPANIFHRRQLEDSSLTPATPVTPSDATESTSSKTCPVRPQSPSANVQPVFTLKSGGVLTDNYSPPRICSIVANHQFQCDPSPGQVDALYLKGFSVCGKNLAIGGSTNWVKCLNDEVKDSSGNVIKAAFYNVYDGSLKIDDSNKQCSPTTIEIQTCTPSSGGGAQAEKRELQWVDQHGRFIGQAMSPNRKRDPFPMDRVGKMWWPMERRR